MTPESEPEMERPKPIMHIEWLSAGTVQQDRDIMVQITEFANGLLGGYTPRVWGTLRPKGTR